ncbi:UNVERIFIED_CONTAM: hypothetical protein PYX00_000087 [Menopon gallinae]|uniref:Uncharacterized protein n=1 Tax=Menopon gallinae TaxID=328185 RepID=A0AAW2I9T5_9NEOP
MKIQLMHILNKGVLDVDNFSLLDDASEFASNDVRLQDSLNALSNENTDPREQVLNGELRDINPYISRPDPTESELNLMKQRELAKRTLLQLNSRLERINQNLKSLDIEKPKGKETKGETEKSVLKSLPEKEVARNWFDQNLSPQTPRFFKDELNSIIEPSVTPVSWLKECGRKSDILVGTINNRPSFEKSVRNKSSISIHPLRESDLDFKPQSQDDILNRLEEDEKKFLKEQSALSNNSDISHFSGITGSQSLLSSTTASKVEDEDRMSIGKYFQLRSNSVNSLIGAKDTEGNVSDVFHNTNNKLPNRKSPAMLDVPTRTIGTEELNLTGEPNSGRLNEKRWFSSTELERISDAASEVRYSNGSAASTSTLLIQNLLCEMDSGLSGTQINDRLLECVDKIKNQKKASKLEVTGNMETPKSSKTGGRVSTSRIPGRGKQDNMSRCVLTSFVRNSRSPLQGKKNVSKSCSEMSSAEFKENLPKTPKGHFVADKNVLTLRNELIKGGRKGFDSSTPKAENTRPNAGKFKFACNKLLMDDADWEPPRISSVRKPISLSDTEEEMENTLHASDGEKFDRTVVDKDSYIPEDSRDLTLVLERISGIKENRFCSEKSVDGGEDILAVVKKLANYPKGSVDCSALTPLLKDKFPELVPTLSVRENQSDTSTSEGIGMKMQESFTASPGSWISMTSKYGENGNVNIVLGLKKLLSLPVKNVTEHWLIISLESMSIQYQTDKCLSGTKMNDEFVIENFLTVHMKNTLIPPNESLLFKCYILPKVHVSLDVKLNLRVTKLDGKESRTENLVIPVTCIFPKRNVTVLPTNEVDFGTIPEECSQEKSVEIFFDGICDLPLKVYIDKSPNFILSPDVRLNGETVKSEVSEGDQFCYTLREGMKSALLFKVIFRPSLTADSNKGALLDRKGVLSVVLDSPVENCPLRQIPLSGRVAFAKFLCHPSSSPLIFRTTEIGQSVKREFPIKNVGSIDIEFSLSVTSEVSNAGNTTDLLFSVPETFLVPKGEKRNIEIFFNGKTKENYVNRNLIMEMIPNGRISYEVELIGIVMPIAGGKSLSRSSSQSGPTHCVSNPGNISYKLKSTTNSVSWAAVPLDTELKQTFHVMNSSNCNATARFSFWRETNAFKFINDNGEAIEKLRKVLKPNCSNAMTVIFRPDCVGPHNNGIIIETNHLSGRKMISLNGYGGAPKIFIRNLKSDLNGSKIIRLTNSEPENQIFSATMEVINKGNIPGFVSVQTIMKVLSLSNGLEIEPANFVLQPNSRTEVRVSQKLKNDDIKRLLSGRDIGKLATMTVTTGDELSRFRLRRVVKEQKMKTSDSIGCLLDEFIGEKEHDIDKFDDDKNFENVFRKNLETIEIAAIIERHTDVCEPTILEDFEETVKEFVTILPAADYSVASLRESERADQPSAKGLYLESSNLSSSSGKSSKSRDKKISKWLATLEKP